MKEEDDTNYLIIATCNCGCGYSLNIKKYKETELPDGTIEYPEYYITFGTTKFNEEQMGIFDIIKRRIKRAWYSLIGKDYRYFDIMLTEEEYKTFCKNATEIQK